MDKPINLNKLVLVCAYIFPYVFEYFWKHVLLVSFKPAIGYPSK